MKIISTSDSLFSSFLPKRNENTSKFDYGRAVLLGGSKDYGGAPLLSLASLSSLRLGAGLLPYMFLNLFTLSMLVETLK